MKIKQYDTIILKDGRTGCVVEVYDNKVFDVDVGESEKDWDTISVSLEDIKEVVKVN